MQLSWERGWPLPAALTAAVVVVYGPWPLGAPRQFDGDRWLALGAAVAGGALLCARRIRPLPVAGVLSAGLLASIFWHLGAGGPLLFLTWVAWFSVSAHSAHRRVAGGLLVAGTVAVIGWVFSGDPGDSGGGFGVALVFTVAYPATAWFLGQYPRLRRAERAAVAAKAVADERTRLGRELHDLLSHTISGMVVLAGGARRVTGTGPAAEALAEIEATGRRGMAETRALLHTLRAEDAPLSRQAIGEIPRLVAGMEQLGLPVSVTIEEIPDDLPVAVSAAAYRITQEALTNVLRHAGPATARLSLRWHESALEVEVTDDGSGGTRADGYGLTGIRERARLLGGTAEAGPLPGSGWRVLARLPVVTP